MRRLIALWVVLAFVAATTAPAFAACRMRAAQHECCCKPALANSICAPHCCATAKPTSAVGDVTTQLRGFAFVAAPALPFTMRSIDAARSTTAPRSVALVGLHERSAPRLPLRI